jgi:hypothetical protein
VSLRHDVRKPSDSTLLAQRALGVVDARARGLVVQTALPGDEAA